MPKTLALRHVPFEDLGLLAPILERRGHTIRYIEVPIANLDGIDLLIPELVVILGGPIGAYEDHAYPFLKAETALIERRLNTGKPVLGVCLGSQLMARALGARVYPGSAKEIGWKPVTLTEEGRNSCLRHLRETAVLHWHGDTFDLPAGALRLASTAICDNQAFSWGRTALGLQFHAEAAGPALESWFVGHTIEISATPDVTVAQLRTETARWTPVITDRGSLCFKEWLSTVGL